MSTTDGQGLRQLLRATVIHQTPLSILVQQPHLSVVGRVSSFGEQGVEVMVRAKVMPSLPVGTACCVSFALSDRHVAFLAPVMGVTRVPPTLRLAMPSDSVVLESRQSMRVPVEGLRGLDVTLADAVGAYPVRVLDLSMGGLRTRLVRRTWPVGQQLWVHLMWRGTRISLRAVLVWRAEDSLGLSFAGLASSPHLGDLTRVVCDVERIWLHDLEALASVA